MDEELQPLEVGSYEELSKKINTQGLTLEYQPPLELLLQEYERVKGKPMSSENIERLKADATVIALPKQSGKS